MKPLHLLVAILVLALGLQTCRLRDSQGSARDNWFRADSFAAVADSTRRISERAERLLGIAVQGYERRIVQEEQKRDALDKALKRERAANAVLTLRIKGVDTIFAANVTEVDSVRIGVFGLRQAPFTVKGSVRLPPPPRPGDVNLQIEVDPLRMNIRLGCHPKDNQGFRRASVFVSLPAWAQAGIDTVSQSREVCNPPKQKNTVKTIAALGLGFLGGWLLKP